MAKPGNANKKKGGPGDDAVAGGPDNDFVDGKSGDDVVAGEGGNDWVKGGSGDDELRYLAVAHADSSALYDGGSGKDDLVLLLSYNEWMRADVQADVAAYLPWLQSKLNGNGTATGHTFDFTAFSLSARMIERLRVEVDGVELNPEDEAVTLAADSATADEDQGEVTGNVLLNDLVPDLVRSVELVEGPAEGSVAIDISGAFTYTYGDLFQYLAADEQIVHTFTYRVTDADLDAAIETVTLTITGVNDVPVANGDQGAITENQTLTVDVLANDTDTDTSDVHTVDAVVVLDDGRSGSPSTEAAPVAAIVANQVVFTPGKAYDYLSSGQKVEAEVGYDMSDNHGGQASSTLLVAITGTNDVPVAVNDAASVDENSVVVVDVVANDYDVDQADTFQVTAVSQSPLGGVASIVNGEEIRFDTNGDFETLAVGQSKAVTLTYEITDNNGAKTSAQAVVTVTGVNDAPVAHLDDATTSESQAVLINVLGNDTDIDAGAVLSIQSAKLVYGQGTVAIDNGKLRYDPAGKYEHVGVGQQAEVIIEYTMKDEHGATSTSAAFVTISGEYDAPTMVETLGGFGTMSVDYASPWHFTRLDEKGSASAINFGAGTTPTGWSNNWNMGFQDQSLFGLGEDGVRAEVSAGFEINPGRTNFIDLDLFDDTWETGFELEAWVDPYFKLELTPFAEVLGGTVDSSHGVNAGISGVSALAGGYKQLVTSAGAAGGNSIAHDMPDAYGAGIDAYIATSLSFGTRAKGGFLGAVSESSSSTTLFDEFADFTLLGAAIDTKDGEVDLELFGQEFSITSVTLPSAIKDLVSINLYDESHDVTTTANAGLATTAETLQKITGIRLDIDDILGKLPAPVGPAFSFLDYSKTVGVSGVASLNLDYTVAGVGFNFDLLLDADSRTTPDFTVDLLFDKPVLVQGYSDPVMALRNADWDALPGLKSFDGSAVKVLPLFNSQLDFDTELSLNLLGALDYKLGELAASFSLLGTDYGFSVGPLAEDLVEMFNVDLVTLGNISYGSTGYDQFAGGSFMLV